MFMPACLRVLHEAGNRPFVCGLWRCVGSREQTWIEPMERIEMIRRLLCLLLLLTACLTSLAACTTDEATVFPGPNAVWVPGHDDGLRWVPGHWA
jgi:hypothetical protein